MQNAQVAKLEEPTQREFEEHTVLHLPFRGWRPHCIKGRAKSEPHRVNKEAEDETRPAVAMDYMWMKSKEERKTGQKTGQRRKIRKCEECPY